jgi:hypothetical protein
MKPLIIPENLTGKELFTFIVKNESLIVHAKKSAVKFADAAFSTPLFVNEKGEIITKDQATEMQQATPNKLMVKVVINTTNCYDSHGDVHMPGIWNKSISDNKRNGYYLLKMHQKTFEDVIGESLIGEAKTMAWSELGKSLAGVTEALVFSGMIEKDRNPYMFAQYQKGYVKQHSVGMRYVKMATCINDEEYPLQKENWDKYFPMVANKSDCEKEGYFFAILEAQVVEGSAVLFASNNNTPTLSIQEIIDDSTKNQPPLGTGAEPQDSYAEWLNKTSLIKIKN